MFGLGVFLIFFAVFVFYMPNLLGDPDNYMPANPLVTPPRDRAGMVLPAVLRDPALGAEHPVHPGEAGRRHRHVRRRSSCSSCCRGSTRSKVRSARSGRSTSGSSGSSSSTASCSAMSARTGRKAGTSSSAASPRLYYFFHFLILLRLLGKFERPLPLPTSISAAVPQGRRPRGRRAARPMEKP